MTMQFFFFLFGVNWVWQIFIVQILLICYYMRHWGLKNEASSLIDTDHMDLVLSFANHIQMRVKNKNSNKFRKSSQTVV